MKARFRSWWQKIRQRRVAIAVTSAIIVVAVALIIVGYWFDVTGFNGYTQVSTIRTLSGPTAGTVTRTEVYQSGKTLWDWMQLLVVPMVLAVTAFLFSLTVSRNEQRIANERYKHDLKLAANKQGEDLLQAYIDRISDLMLTHNLCASDPLNPEKEVRSIARARTLTTLSQLDNKRKKSVLQFLCESNLIQNDQECIISLSDADLKGADLRFSRLRGTNLCRTNLRNAKLNNAVLHVANLRLAILHNADLLQANLLGASLKGADLSGANLSGANLSGTNLHAANLHAAKLQGIKWLGATLHATKLQGAKLSGTKWHGASLHSTDLNHADLSHADLSGTTTLQGANLSEADLSSANLSKAKLIGADLSKANLIDANLNKANLTDANLSGAIVTEEQAASNLNGAIITQEQISTLRVMERTRWWQDDGINA